LSVGDEGKWCTTYIIVQEAILLRKHPIHETLHFNMVGHGGPGKNLTVASISGLSWGPLKGSHHCNGLLFRCEGYFKWMCQLIIGMNVYVVSIGVYEGIHMLFV
jgi:hypothetical protein